MRSEGVFTVSSVPTSAGINYDSSSSYKQPNETQEIEEVAKKLCSYSASSIYLSRKTSPHRTYYIILRIEIDNRAYCNAMCNLNGCK